MELRHGSVSMGRVPGPPIDITRMVLKRNVSSLKFINPFGCIHAFGRAQGRGNLVSGLELCSVVCPRSLGLLHQNLSVMLPQNIFRQLEAKRQAPIVCGSRLCSFEWGLWWSVPAVSYKLVHLQTSWTHEAEVADSPTLLSLIAFCTHI